MTRVLLLPFFLLAATPVTAEEQLPPPDYFVQIAMETTTAQVLAVNCRTLSVDIVAMGQRTDEALELLTEDGFTPENLAERMADPTDAITALQDAFTEKHGLSDGADEATVCAAGLAEIAEGTSIGALLLEVEG